MVVDGGEREEFEVVSATLKSARSDWSKKFQIK
jgi:hypothetical protein